MEYSVEKIRNVFEFYALAHKLKNTLRSGWIVWDMRAERFESVAEHIYGTQMLAFAVNSEFELGLDIGRVIMMLAVHELGETIIGDIPVVGGKLTRAEKHEMEMAAVEKVLSPLSSSEAIRGLFVEFEERETNEARFAFFMDKLDATVQCRFYEDMGCNDMTKAREGEFKELCRAGIEKGFNELAKLWVDYDKKHFYSENELLVAIADFVAENSIFKARQE